MEPTSADELAHIGEALASVRAAIDVVEGGAAERVIVHVRGGRQILPAARALARTAGVVVEPSAWPDDEDGGCDIVIRAVHASA
jgi:hypothetical protein